MDQPKPMTLDVLSDKTNAAVVRMQGRRFPGVVVQGDTLSVIVYRARNVCEQIAAGGDALNAARELLAGLETLQAHYESVLSAHGLPLPYDKGGR